MTPPDLELNIDDLLSKYRIARQAVLERRGLPSWCDCQSRFETDDRFPTYSGGLRDRVAAELMRIVDILACNVTRGTVPLEDLRQVGRIELHRSVERCDIQNPWRTSSRAFMLIRSRIQQVCIASPFSEFAVPDCEKSIVCKILDEYITESNQLSSKSLLYESDEVRENISKVVESALASSAPMDYYVSGNQIDSLGHRKVESDPFDSVWKVTLNREIEAVLCTLPERERGLSSFSGMDLMEMETELIPR